VKTRGGNLPTVLATLRQQWEKLNPEFPFEFHFLDKGIDELYNSEAKIGAISFACTVLAVGISCLGLFGMSIFLVRQKTKEIGIRKVLGASVAGVVLMLTKGFAKWVILANLIAWPLAYYFMHQWLQNYAYRVEIGWPVFLLSGALALVVALLTVSYQTVRAATANPVEALRHE
jgi:putative ABC transport system permease protein